MRRDIAEAGISLSKTFTFGISTDLTKYFTKDIVKLTLEEDRDLDIKVVEDTSLNMEKLIENGSVDVGFFGTDIINNEALDYMSIKKDMLWLVCGKGNPRLKDTNRFAFLPNFFISGNGLTDDVALCSVDGDAFPIFIVMARAKNRPLSGKAKKLVRAIRDFTDNSGI